VVILEPDALASMSCLSATDQQTRFMLLSDAVSVLKTQGNIAVYLDAGHPGWPSVSDIVSRLQQANIAQADGFSLDASNYILTSDNIAEGQQISSLIGGKHFIVDTSRNGLGPTPDYQWCNALGRALGNRPTVSAGNILIDAFLWIKRPGESDGYCNGGPAAGSWWADYALGLAQLAAW
jgi:endoglucanase